MLRAIGLSLLLVFAFVATTSLINRSLENNKVQNEVTQQFPEFPLVATNCPEFPLNPIASHERRAFLLNLGYMALYITLGLVIYVGYRQNKAMFLKQSAYAVPALLLLLTFTSGCNPLRRPFEPVNLEVIGSNEEGFLIPLIGDVTKQGATNSEDLLTAGLIQAKQVKIPQQWVPTGYETVFPCGQWKDAAVLIKVDRSPVTCEWTADAATGTSNKNEAIWVMTSDQVEFSTGWTCTARISNSTDAITFLHNYPNGSIKGVMDREVRALVQTTFGIEVTDQPMSKLRLEATPHIASTVDKVVKFFSVRGLTITNLGISGGFVYKDQKIQDKLVELFNAEQEQTISLARASALKVEADGRAEAAKTTALGEAEAIKSVADAKAYEIDKAQQNLETYLQLKRLEIERDKIEKWNGSFPSYYMGTDSPDVLLSVPTPKAPT